MTRYRGYMKRAKDGFLVGAEGGNYKGPVAHVSHDNRWLYINADDYEGLAMLNIEALPHLMRALRQIQKSVKTAREDGMKCPKCGSECERDEERVGEASGVAARISDDGSVRYSIAALKVPELVLRDQAAQVAALREERDKAVKLAGSLTLEGHNDLVKLAKAEAEVQRLMGERAKIAAGLHIVEDTDGVWWAKSDEGEVECDTFSDAVLKTNRLANNSCDKAEAEVQRLTEVLAKREYEACRRLNNLLDHLGIPPLDYDSPSYPPTEQEHLTRYQAGLEAATKLGEENQRLTEALAEKSAGLKELGEALIASGAAVAQLTVENRGLTEALQTARAKVLDEVTAVVKSMQRPGEIKSDHELGYRNGIRHVLDALRTAGEGQ